MTSAEAGGRGLLARWAMAYAAAVAVASILGALLGWATGGPWAGPLFWLFNTVPAVAVTLLLPILLAGLLLRLLRLWSLAGFVVVGALIPLSLFFGVTELAPDLLEGPRFVLEFAVWVLVGAASGAAFHQVWERLA
jgi:hypothetical protein